jgi:Zn-finger nucleic acid-binding protein
MVDAMTTIRITKTCPECGLNLDGLEYKLANFKICPRCEKTPLKDFLTTRVVEKT